MRRYILAICLSLVVLTSLFLFYKFNFQNKDDVRSILGTKDFKELEAFIEKLTKEKRSPRWIYLRDLTYEYQEGIFEYKEYEKNENGSITTSYDIFQIKLIVSGNKIIYYEYNIQKNKKVKYEWSDSFSWEPYYITIEQFKNDIEFKLLKEEFNNVFYSDLNESELFVTDYVYGENCGVAAVDSNERTQLNYFVTKKEKNSILKWLKSTNTEKQVYAVEGLLKLEKSGVNLNNTEVEIINYITHKKGTIRMCSGCTYFDIAISKLTKTSPLFVKSDSADF